jgi:hypothetical protein
LQFLAQRIKHRRNLDAKGQRLKAKVGVCDTALDIEKEQTISRGKFAIAPLAAD